LAATSRWSLRTDAGVNDVRAGVVYLAPAEEKQ
jgi:hypothetical protein